MSARVDLPAEFNIYAVADVWRSVNAGLPAAGSRDDLAIDCAQLREIDAAGVQVLLSLAHTARQRAISLQFASMPAFLSERLQALGAADLFATSHDGETRHE